LALDTGEWSDSSIPAKAVSVPTELEAGWAPEPVRFCTEKRKCIFPYRESSRDSSVVEHVLRLSVCVAVLSDMVDGLEDQFARMLKKAVVAFFKIQFPNML